MPSTQRRRTAQLKVPEPQEDTVIVSGTEKKKRGRPVTKTATSTDIAASGVKQGATRGRGRPRKDTVQNEGGTTARMETEDSAQKQREADEGQETVTTMVNYVATTWWNSTNGRDAEKEIEIGTSSSVPQPEDA